jgi:hypothetical protein
LNAVPVFTTLVRRPSAALAGRAPCRYRAVSPANVLPEIEVGVNPDGLRAGEYRAEVAVRSGGADWAKGELFFSVEGRDAETENPAPDFAALGAVSRASGGRFLPLAEAGKLPEMLGKVLPQPQPHVRSLRTTLWDRAWLLWLATSSLCGAWVILRRGR